MIIEDKIEKLSDNCIGYNIGFFICMVIAIITISIFSVDIHNNTPAFVIFLGSIFLAFICQRRRSFFLKEISNLNTIESLKYMKL